MAMGACPGQIPMPCVPPTLMVTATMVRACRYICWSGLSKHFTFHLFNNKEVYYKTKHQQSKFFCNQLIYIRRRIFIQNIILFRKFFQRFSEVCAVNLLSTYTLNVSIIT